MHQWKQSTLESFLELYPRYYPIPYDWTLIIPYFVLFYFFFKPFSPSHQVAKIVNDFSSRGTQSSLKPNLPFGIDIWTCSSYYLCAPYTCEKLLTTIPFQNWALSHDGGRRYGIMTTNMSEVFNSVLQGARSLPVTALVQLNLFRLNITLLHERNKVITDWHQMSSILHILMLRLRHM